jgi:CRISPR-associated endonuclease/helicase Cas3
MLTGKMGGPSSQSASFLAHYAHSLTGRPLGEWHRLEEHLTQTADLAEGFASPFAPGWGRLAGLWHDAGKYQRSFQVRIGGVDPDAHTNAKVDHSSVGALMAKERRARPLSFVIAGHHGGMSNADDLAARLIEKADLLSEARRDGLPQWIEEPAVPNPPGWFTDQSQFSLWTRLLFSALVDADFLDTEKFYARGVERNLGRQPSLIELKTRLDAAMERKSATADLTPMNQMRNRVLAACRTNAELTPGVFTLTVPTGGGKTLSSLAFALDHAIKHGLRRVIVVIPFTTIIDQTAKVYREVLGNEAVLEHHTNIDPDKETPVNRLASENWDAPVVVTTNVQFFESLYANRPSRCRKLHRIANSVVIFDEVQTFPVHLLAPVKHVLRELTGQYGVTALLCTATQPTILENTREIVPEPTKEFSAVATRCDVLMPKDDTPIGWEALAAELKEHSQALAIVHRRDDAQRLAELMGSNCLHLSARMCAKHRTKVLATVKQQLIDGAPCQLVATQLVEAGVDIDFPEVYRAFAGADSLAQAAGRCNREGKGSGRLHVFMAPTKPPRGILRTAQEVSRTMWIEGRLDLKNPDTFVEYFTRLYGRAEQDSRSVMAAEREQRFKDVAEQFKMIEEAGQPVVAPFGDWQPRVEDVRKLGVSRDRMRRLQPFMVNLYPQEIAILVKAGALERIQETFWSVVPGFNHIYSERWGFGWQGPVYAEPESLIA